MQDLNPGPLPQKSGALRKYSVMGRGSPVFPEGKGQHYSTVIDKLLYSNGDFWLYCAYCRTGCQSTNWTHLWLIFQLLYFKNTDKRNNFLNGTVKWYFFPITRTHLGQALTHCDHQVLISIRFLQFLIFKISKILTLWVLILGKIFFKYAKWHWLFKSYMFYKMDVECPGVTNSGRLTLWGLRPQGDWLVEELDPRETSTCVNPANWNTDLQGCETLER